MSEVPMAATSAAQRERVAWVDYSKGICIFLVLMLHASTEIMKIRGSQGWLGAVVEFARPFRMPDFFLIAGLFLSNVIDRPWKTYLDKKVIHFLYFYVLWTAIYFVLFDIKGTLYETGGDWSAVLPAYLLTFVQPGSSLWFVHSLAIFFLVVRVCRAVPWWLMLGGAATLQMLPVDSGSLVIDEFCRRFIYFYSGYWFARYLFQMADWAMANLRSALVYLFCWAILNQALVASGGAIIPGVSLALGYLGAVAVVFSGVLLSQLPWARGLRYIGESSIVLYLGDHLIQKVALKLGVGQLFDPGSAALLLTCISVLGTLFVAQGARRVGFAFLYRRPSWAKLEAARATA